MKCIVRNIKATIGNNPVFTLDNISFGLKEGQILVILGHSGAGKTSLLNVLAGFLPIEHGAIILDDKTVSCASFCLPPTERNTGVIFQNHNLLPHLTLFENLTLGLKNINDSTKQKQIKTMLKMLQLSHLQKTLPDEASGGQQQRIALGRAILHNKKLLLFDEPFSGLDHARMAQLAAITRYSVKIYKKIAILVTHQLDEAFLIADMIGIMKDGKFLDINSPESLYHAPTTLEVAKYVGPVNVIAGKRIATKRVQTSFGVVAVENTIPKEIADVNILTRPDDFTFQKGSDYEVTNSVFLGMNKLVTVSRKEISLQMMLDHHLTLYKGDRVGVFHKNSHSYIAYGKNGQKI